MSLGLTILTRNWKNTVFGITESGEKKEYLMERKTDVLEKCGTFEELRIEMQGM